MFHLTNSPKAENIQFTIIKYKEKQKYSNINTANIWHFCLKTGLSDYFCRWIFCRSNNPLIVSALVCTIIKTILQKPTTKLVQNLPLYTFPSYWHKRLRENYSARIYRNSNRWLGFSFANLNIFWFSCCSAIVNWIFLGFGLFVRQNNNNNSHFSLFADILKTKWSIE